jgi:hypothetical protein
MNLTLSLKAFLLFLPPRVGTFSTRLISITGNLRVEPTRFSSEGIQSAIFVMERGWNVLWWVTERSIPSSLTLLDVHTVQTGSHKLVSWEFLLGVNLDSVPKHLNIRRYKFRAVVCFYRLRCGDLFCTHSLCYAAKRWLFNCVLSMTLLLSCKLLSSLIQWKILRSCKAKYIFYRNPGNIYIYIYEFKLHV